MQAAEESKEARPVSQSEIDAKLLKYESFIDDKLKPDLRKILEKRDQIDRELSQYLQLRNTLEMIREQKLKVFETQVDVGCSFYLQAESKDLSKVMVKIGADVFVELSPDQAITYIGKKEKFLSHRSELLTEQAAQVKAHIAFVIEASRELMNISGEKEKKMRDDFM
ncbi:hypothetical protein FGO68_gene13414 [Halteria grandinella]|uniref:Uncharacterized protein n=1 Tax=Halteria grandinella TaxID=5974 RepID=A0A8J8NJI4_HALGN|nr:hypothetical protein FGO68_gene13414 [Halteria grandinella]